MQCSFMPPCLRTCCCLGCPLPLLARCLLDLIWDQLKKSAILWGHCCSRGGIECFPLLLPVTQQRDHGCGYQVMLLCILAVQGTSVPSLPGIRVGGSEGWDNIFRRKSGRFAKMLKCAHPLTATWRRRFHSFIYSTSIYWAFTLFKVVF